MEICSGSSGESVRKSSKSKDNVGPGRQSRTLTFVCVSQGVGGVPPLCMGEGGNDPKERLPKNKRVADPAGKSAVLDATNALESNSVLQKFDEGTQLSGL